MIIPELVNIENTMYRSELYIKKHYSDFYNFIQQEYNDICKFNEKIYCYVHKCKPHTCPVCGKVTTFRNFTLGYSEFCSPKCASVGTREKTKQICLEKYGVENVSQLPSIKRKKEKTCLKNHGTLYPMQSAEVINKSKQTCLEKYGVDSHTKTEGYKKKQREYNLEKYGTEYYMSSSDFKNKSKKTLLEKYGDENYNNREKYRRTNIEKYGEDSYSKTEDFKSKSKQTKLDRYGDENYNNPEKRKQTCIEKYGYEYNLSSPDIREKIKQTCLEKYGTISYTQSDDYRKYKHNEIQEKIYNTKKANNSFNKSTIEEEFRQYLEDNHINYIYQYRSDLYPFDCDFYFPDKDIYLEINGSWVHGGYPYNPIGDKNKLESWVERAKSSEYYKNAIETWTIRDPKKVRVAKDNNINLKVFYGHKMSDLKKFFEKEML